MKSDPDAFRRLPLRAHHYLADMPLHDCWSIDLPGGVPGCDLPTLLERMQHQPLNAPSRALFALRESVGRLFDWDSAPAAGVGAPSLADALDDADRRASAVPPGTPRGPFRIVYVHAGEALSEIENRTVRAALVQALEARGDSWRFHLGIYVEPVSRWTGLYMAAIAPFRRFVVYPSLLRGVERAWRASD